MRVGVGGDGGEGGRVATQPHIPDTCLLSCPQRHRSLDSHSHRRTPADEYWPWPPRALRSLGSQDGRTLECPVSSPGRAAVTEYHGPGGLHNRRLFLPVLESAKAGVGVLPQWGAGVRMAPFLLCPRLVERWLVPASPYSDTSVT